MDKIIVNTFKINIVIRILIIIIITLLLSIWEIWSLIPYGWIVIVNIVTSVFVGRCKRCYAVIGGIVDAIVLKIVIVNVIVLNTLIITMIAIVMLGAFVNCIKT